MKLSVRARLFITTLTLIILVELVSSLFFHSHLTEWIKSNHTQRLVHAIKKTAQHIDDNQLTLDAMTVVFKVSSANLNLRVTLIKPDGALLYDSALPHVDVTKIESHLHRPEVQKALQVGFAQARRWSNTLKTELIYVTHRLKQGSILRFATDTQQLDQQFQHLGRILWLVFGFSMFLALIVSGFASYLLSLRLKYLVSFAKRLARGESKRVDAKRPFKFQRTDEYGKLANSLSQIANQIEQQVSALADSRDRFEEVFNSMREAVIALDEES